VYIKEAHAQDVWPISSSRYAHDGCPVLVEAPCSNIERCQLAAAFMKNYGISDHISTFVDSLEAGDPFEAMYAPWPFRFYILQREADGVVRVAMKAQPYEASYNISDVRNFLLDQRR